MASFDLILTVGKAYRKTWRERAYLFRMALIPLLVKYICFAVAIFYIEQDNIIRKTIIMLPAYFVEGWFLAHWVRTVAINHRWPFRPSGDDAKDEMELRDRGRGILGGAITFTLINFVMAGYFTFFQSYIPVDMDPKHPDPQAALAGAVMMVTTVLLFRFIWSYIPMAVNFPFSEFVRKLKRLSTTFNMMGVWLVCFIPSVLLLQLSVNFIKVVYVDGGALTSFMDGIIIFLQVFLDMVKNLLCTAGMTYAFIEIFKWRKEK